MSARQQQVPPRFGRYRVTGVIGEGAMGVVYRAIDPLLDRPVAIKAIHASLLAARDMAAAERFRNEARAAARLAHPGIVRVHEYGAQADGAFIAMECIDGAALEGVRLALPDTLCAMVQLLDALEHAHAQGVCHRDIKPANLLVDRDGRLKVTDFGIARIDDAPGLTIETQAMGSPGYMAPERYTGEPCDERVDIFSCGALLHELLTGTPPFEADSGSGAMHNVLFVEPAPPSQADVEPRVPQRFDAIVARALAKSAADRYASAREMRDALLAAAAAEGCAVAAMLSAEVIEALAPAIVEHDEAATSSGSFGAATLARLEALLVPHVGPVAGLMVRGAAQRCCGVPAMVSRLAADALAEGDRKAFIADALRALSSGPDPAWRIPLLGASPLRPQLLDGAERALARHVGPIARLLVDNAARGAATREHFIGTLADLAADGDADRERLFAELARV